MANSSGTCLSAVRAIRARRSTRFGRSARRGGGGNVGLQFLTIPSGPVPSCPTARGTPTSPTYITTSITLLADPADNKTWNAADPTSGLQGGRPVRQLRRTWAKHFRGYSQAELLAFPRVTTETGCTIGGPITEEVQARNQLTMYLDQFKRGWSHTAVYLLRDRADEGGNQSFGFFKPDYAPRESAVYLHNLTTILADRGSSRKARSVEIHHFESQPPQYTTCCSKGATARSS